MITREDLISILCDEVSRRVPIGPDCRSGLAYRVELEKVVKRYCEDKEIVDFDSADKLLPDLIKHVREVYEPDLMDFPHPLYPTNYKP